MTKQNMHTPNVQLLTVEQVAAQLQIKPATLYQWRTQNRGPKAFKYGNLVRFRRSDLDEWMSQQVEAGK